MYIHTCIFIWAKHTYICIYEQKKYTFYAKTAPRQDSQPPLPTNIIIIINGIKLRKAKLQRNSSEIFKKGLYHKICHINFQKEFWDEAWCAKCMLPLTWQYPVDFLSLWFLPPKCKNPETGRVGEADDQDYYWHWPPSGTKANST